MTCLLIALVTAFIGFLIGRWTAPHWTKGLDQQPPDHKFPGGRAGQ